MKFPQVIDLFRKKFLEEETPITVDIIEQIYIAYNAERTSRDIPRLRLNSKLSQAAQLYADWLYCHDRFDFTDISKLVIEAGYKPQVVGENVAKGYSSVSSAMSAWMVSSNHRSNILRPCYTDIGLATVDEYWCAIFATQGPTINNEIRVHLTGGPVHAPLCG